MNSSPRHNESRADDQRTLEPLLDHIRLHFYAAAHPALFHRDRRRLLHALTWPAVWLESRGLYCSPPRYRALVTERIEAIRAHGDPARWGAYFPTYLLKCLQDFLRHHGDDLDHELKHIRNTLESLQASFVFAQAGSRQSKHIEVLATAHRLLHPKPRARSSLDPAQFNLF